MSSFVSPYPNLFSPIDIGPLHLKNKLVMAPLSTGYCAPDGSVTERMIEYYAARAGGGASMIIVEYAHIDDKASRTVPTQLAIHKNAMIPGLAELVDRIHLEGSLAGIQIAHAGRQRSLGYPVLAPSAIPSFRSAFIPEEATVEDLREIVASFADAAKRAVRAGFDYIEIHGAHGYLIHEFLSPYTNHRTDMYGGSLVNRMRFPLEVVNAVRAVVPPDVLLGYRLSAIDGTPGGLTIEDSEQTAQAIEAAGVEFLFVTAGMHDSDWYNIQPMFLPREFNVSLATRIKNKLSIPVMVANSVNRPEIAEKVLAEGKVDLVAMARPFLADPQLAAKAEAGRADTIAPCIRCNSCLLRDIMGKSSRCAVNYECGREYQGKAQPAGVAKYVLVVGGGPGGLEAAAVLTERGHRVKLCERTDQLGGRLSEASIPPFKADIKDLQTYLIRRIERLGIDVSLNTIVDADYVKQGEFDAVVIATGADVGTVNLPASEKMTVLTTEEAGYNPPKGKRVAVVGGGLVGVELAWYLATLGNQITLTTRRDLDVVAFDTGSPAYVMNALHDNHVRMIGNVKLDRIEAESIVVVDRNWCETRIPCDVVIVASGFKPRTELLQAVKALSIPVYAVGDCVRPRKIMDAIHEASFVARKI